MDREIAQQRSRRHQKSGPSIRRVIFALLIFAVIVFALALLLPMPGARRVADPQQTSLHGDSNDSSRNF